MSSVQPSQEVLVSGAGRPAEQTFQVVNKKPSQAGGRKGVGSKDHTQSGSRSYSHSHRGEESSQVESGTRKKAHSSHSKDKETKVRPSNQRYSSSKSSVGTSSSQSKMKEANHTHHHSSRHRNVNPSDAAIGSGGKSIGKPASKITSSNRFEKLDPDIDCESSATVMGVSACVSEEDSTQGSTTVSSSVSTSRSAASVKGAEERKTGWSGAKDRSIRGGRSSSRKGASGRHVQETNGPVSASASTEELENDEKENSASKKKSSKHTKFDVSCNADNSSRQDSAYYSGTSTSISSLSIDHEERADENSSPSMLLTNDSEEKARDGEPLSTEGQEGTDQQANRQKRIVYEREVLLQLKTEPLSKECPLSLKRSCVILGPYSAPSNSSDDQTQLDTGTRPPEEGPKSKHPTALSLIKDHDKLLGKVCLSPQRRSFQRGCSWKEKGASAPNNTCSVDSGSPTAASPLNNSHSDAHFSFDNQKSHGSHGSSSHPVPRVIHHTPLREREHLEGRRDSRRNWESTGQDSHRNKHRNNHYQEEPEPEWMEFGPTDRFDVIELRGFEDEEEESLNTAGETGEALDGNTAPLTSPKEKDGPDNSSNKICKKDDSKEIESDLSSKKAAGTLEGASASKMKDNEYMFDGFDFSTGVSICQELDIDEDEGGIRESLSTSLLAHEAMNSPTQLSNALLKVLGVNGRSDPTPAAEPSQSTASSLAQRPPGIEQPPRNTVAGGGSVPVNALTLDEVHARENIHPSTSQDPVATGSSGQGMAAFNKLIAAMESSRAQQDCQKGQPNPEDSSRYLHQAGHDLASVPTSSHPMHLPPPPPLRYPLHGPSRPSEKGVGRPSLPPTYNLDRELLDIEEDLSTSEDFLRGTGEPNLRRLEQLRHMISKLDYTDPMATPIPQPSPYGPHPHLAHPHLRTHPSTSHPVHVDRDSSPRGNWIFSDRQRHQMEWGLRPSPHQIALARQQQMIAGGSSSNVGRTANNWAVEMERRRIMELRQMQLAKEKEVYAQGNPPHTYGNSVPLHSSITSSKPNISLLPTAVVRQMHSSKSNHQDGEVSKLSGLGTQSSQVHNSQMHHTESIHTHPPGQPPPPPPTHAAGLGDYGGYHHHHAPQMPPRVGPGPPLGGSAYPHKVVPDSLPPMAYHPQYNMPMSHGGLPVQTPYPY